MSAVKSRKSQAARSAPAARQTTRPRVVINLCADDDLKQPVDCLFLKRTLRAVAKKLNLQRLELNVVVIGDQAMAALHEQFSGIKGTTDVLTFDLSDGDDPSELEAQGEIYICLDEAERRAAELGHGTEKELLLYATHGLLHLLGYDDHGDREYRRMHRREDELLQSLGLGKVFARGAWEGAAQGPGAAGKGKAGVRKSAATKSVSKTRAATKKKSTARAASKAAGKRSTRSAGKNRETARRA